jgi:hypothetical protein
VSKGIGKHFVEIICIYIDENEIMEYGQTAYNRTVYAAPPVGGLASIRLGRLRLPRLIAAHFTSPGLCFAKPLSGLAKRRKQSERYVQYGPAAWAAVFPAKRLTGCANGTDNRR